MRSLAISGGAAALTVVSGALANPMMMVNDVYVEQFPGTTHVQISRHYSTGGSSTTTVSRDGSALQITFETTSGESRDLGSGMRTLSVQLGCDCSVPLGHHSYDVTGHTVELDVVAASAATGTVRTPSAQCDQKCASSTVAPPPTGGSSNTGTTASGVGGATVVVGNGGTTATGGTTAARSSTTTGGDTGTTATEEPQKNSDDSSGCTVSRTARSPLPVGALLALSLLVLRRRK